MKNQDPRFLLILTLGLPALVLLSSPAFAGAKHATKEEARAMAIKAADYLRKEDPEKALVAFNAGGDWRDGDLYVFVIDKAGTWRAHGARPEIVGTNNLNTPDADGIFFIKKIVAIDEIGWVDYTFDSPAGNQFNHLSSYFVRVGDFLVSAGAYRHASSRPALHRTSHAHSARLRRDRY
jgi:cytochrome c